MQENSQIFAGIFWACIQIDRDIYLDAWLIDATHGYHQTADEGVGARVAVAKPTIGEVVDPDTQPPVAVNRVAQLQATAKLQLRTEIDAPALVIGGDVETRGQDPATGKGEVPAQADEIIAGIVLRHHRPQGGAQTPRAEGGEAVFATVAPAVAGAIEQADNPGIELDLGALRGKLATLRGGEGHQPGNQQGKEGAT